MSPLKKNHASDLSDGDALPLNHAAEPAAPLRVTPIGGGGDRHSAHELGGPVGEMHAQLIQRLAADPAFALPMSPMDRGIETFSRMAGVGTFSVALVSVVYWLGGLLFG